MKCQLCGRPFDSSGYQKHHLKPKTFRTRSTEVHDENNKVKLHKICHAKIHATFEESSLYNTYNTVKALQEVSDIASFIKWVSKKPPSFYDKCKRRKPRL